MKIAFFYSWELVALMGYKRNFNTTCWGKQSGSMLSGLPNLLQENVVVSTQLKIIVLMGGPSLEHDVSVNSGNMVLKSIDQSKYDTTPVLIDRDGMWCFPECSPMSIFDAVIYLKTMSPTCIFVALHGAFGEDGKIQGFLDTLDIPYTGSGCAASALAFDKIRCKAVVQAQGVRVAGHVALDRTTWIVDQDTVVNTVRNDIGFPCVIKANRQGSSFGIVIASDEAAFRKGMSEVLEIDDMIMVEEYIAGLEITCGVLDSEANGLIRPLPLTEIRPRSSSYFDYEAKYTPGASEEITPARIAPELTEKIQDIALHVHDIVGCEGWSRSDFIVYGDTPIWLEVNTVPGLTQTSLYPQAAAAAGISYPDMVTLFIEAAIRKASQHKVEKGQI